MTTQKFLYRVLRRDEMFKEGIEAKDPSANKSVLDHVANGSFRSSQYISTSETLSSARQFSQHTRFKPVDIVKIDVEKLMAENEDIKIIDPMDSLNYQDDSQRRAWYFARKFQEVLIVGKIPASCVSFVEIVPENIDSVVEVKKIVTILEPLKYHDVPENNVLVPKKEDIENKNVDTESDVGDVAKAENSIPNLRETISVDANTVPNGDRTETEREGHASDYEAGRQENGIGLPENNVVMLHNNETVQMKEENMPTNCGEIKVVNTVKECAAEEEDDLQQNEDDIPGDEGNAPECEQRGVSQGCKG